jgi:hypothetical protein
LAFLGLIALFAPSAIRKFHFCKISITRLQPVQDPHPVFQANYCSGFLQNLLSASTVIVRLGFTPTLAASAHGAPAQEMCRDRHVQHALPGHVLTGNSLKHPWYAWASRWTAA